MDAPNSVGIDIRETIAVSVAVSVADTDRLHPKTISRSKRIGGDGLCIVGGDREVTLYIGSTLYQNRH